VPRFTAFIILLTSWFQHIVLFPKLVIYFWGKGFDLHYLSGRFERQFFVSEGEDFLSWTSIPVALVAACSLLLTHWLNGMATLVDGR